MGVNNLFTGHIQAVESYYMLQNNAATSYLCAMDTKNNRYKVRERSQLEPTNVVFGQVSAG